MTVSCLWCHIIIRKSESSSSSTSCVDVYSSSLYRPNRTPRCVNASSRFLSSADVKPHHAEAAYVSLAMTTALYTVLNASQFIPWLWRTEGVQRLCTFNNTWDAVTSLTSLSSHAAMLEVYFMRTKTELKCGNLKFLRQCYSQVVFFFDWHIIPHTTVNKHTQIYDVTLMQQVIPPTWQQ